MAKIDERIVRVSIDIGGQLKVYENLWIASTGCKYANALQNEAEVRIANLSKADRDYFLTETSPFNKNPKPKKLILEAGRKSTGTTKIYEGNISACKPTQPPDIILQFKCQANQYLKGKIIASSQSATVPLSQIARQIAGDNDLSLNFQADDKNVSNYSFTGASLRQVGKLGEVGGVDAYVDDNELIVKNLNVPLKGQIRILNAKSGMIGIPEITELGVKVTYLLDNQTKLGGAVQIESEIYPTVNGKYSIYKLGWNIASREVPFYWVPECVRHEGGGVVLPRQVSA